MIKSRLNNTSNFKDSAFRKIILGNIYENFKNNKISTSEYTCLTFIPLNLRK